MTAPWLVVAHGYLGTTEIPGKTTAPAISRWLRELRAWWTDDETPWCGVFVGAVLREAGCAIPKHWYRARGWLDYGAPTPSAWLGSIVVFERAGGGHVGFVIGHDERQRLMVMGGNQANAVNIQPFDLSRVLGYRWPTLADGRPASNPRISPPLIQSGGRVSSREEA